MQCGIEHIKSLYIRNFQCNCNNFKKIDGEDIVVVEDDLKFIITNHSGYTNTYRYALSDLMDGDTPLFEYTEGK